MKKIFIFGGAIIFLICVISAALATDVCDTEIDPNTNCWIISPAGLGCSKVTVYNESGQKDLDSVSMSELYTDSGVYKYTFNFNSQGAYTIVLCDNTTSTLTVKNTTAGSEDYAYLTAILDNQVVIDDDILATNDSLHNTVVAINATISSDTSNIWNYLTNSTMWRDVWTYTTRTLTSFSTIATEITEFMENRTEYYYDDSNFYPDSWEINYTNLGSVFNRTFEYDGDSMLRNITQERIR